VKILAETSTLVSASICWKYKEQDNTYSLKHHFFQKCSTLFEVCRQETPDNLIITKTVEDEAKNALRKAVDQTIRDQPAYNLPFKYGLMVLQHLVLNDALDRLDYYVESCSIRLPIDRAERNSLKINEIEPFLKEISKNTLRFIQPSIPSFIGKSLRDELTDKIVQSLPTKGVIYKGMAEAAMIYKKYNQKETIYVASVDNHFKPNPIQIGSWNDRSMHFTGELDSTIRDKITKKFGFISEDPDKIVPLLSKH
jgi:hypothetical protein